MNPEVKAAWVAALESGDYKQGRSRLRTEVDEYCCLGVLCELAVKAGVIPPAAVQHDTWHYAEEDLLLPREVGKWAGLNPADAPEGTENDFEVNPTVLNPDYGRDDEDAHEPGARVLSLAELNDADNYEDFETFTHRYPFPAIANLIREHL